MKFVYLILILLAIFVALKCFETKPEIQEKKEDTKKKIEGFYASRNDIEVDENKKMEYINMIKEEYMDLNYDFNPATLPVTTRYIPLSDHDFVLFYRNKIREYTTKMSNGKLEVIDVLPIKMQETYQEFILDAVTKYKYNNMIFDVQVKYYGVRFRPDNIFDTKDAIVFQLIDIKPYVEETPPKPNLDDIKTNNMSVVDFIAERKRLHESESMPKIPK